MNFNSTDTQAMAAEIKAASEDVVAAYRASGPHAADVVSPELLAEALRQFIEIQRRIEVGRSEGVEADTNPEPSPGALPSDDITELGDYALGLLQDLLQWATQLRREDAQRRLTQLAVPVALWVARHGGYINALEPVVNALATLANTTRTPAALTELSAVMAEITAAVSPTLQSDIDRSEPGRPWRILNLNHGIVATRTHDPAIMRAVFDALVANLPEDAPAFFAEGMVQMDALNYPAQVREVMENYHRRFTVETLH